MSLSWSEVRCPQGHAKSAERSENVQRRGRLSYDRRNNILSSEHCLPVSVQNRHMTPVQTRITRFPFHLKMSPFRKKNQNGSSRVWLLSSADFYSNRRSVPPLKRKESIGDAFEKEEDSQRAGSEARC